MLKYKYKISVIMISYNHEKYIKRAIEGVLDQIVDFDFELIVADDNSPDSTMDVVNKVISNHSNGHLVKYTKHNDNKGMRKNFLWSLNQANGNYIAICDGDDYWIDRGKLQKQIDFMDNNSDVAVCGTYCDKLEYDILVNTNVDDPDVKIFNFNHVITSLTVPTLTICFRKDSLYLNDIENYKFADLPILLQLTKNGGNIAKLPFISGVYRYHGKGANSGSKEVDNYLDFMFIKFDFCHRNKIITAKTSLLKYYGSIFMDQIKHLLKGRFKRFSITLFVRSISYAFKTLTIT